MRVTTVRAVAVAALVVLAGCSGVVSQGDQPTATATPATDASTANQGYSVTVVSQTTGSDDGVDFYVSDEENAIDDFRHLNVTITSVGFQRADGGNESEGGWVERDVDNRSVDLTRLKGANATRLTNVDAPNGSYDKVFAYVGSVDATLASGEQVRVKLPSEKLQIQKPFTVGDGEAVDFVFDIAVHRAGNSGKYILRPVVSQSGTDVPITSIDEEDDEDESPLDVAFVGNVTRGENATLEVTRNGSAVANATVTIDDRVGTTDADGRVTVAIPDADEVEIEVESDDAETELELTFESDDEETEEAETDDDETDEAESEAEETDEAETEEEEAETDEAETEADEETEEDEEPAETEEETEETEDDEDADDEATETTTETTSTES